MELGYDFLKFFCEHCNSLSSIQPGNRMEIIEINGYTIEEKIEIKDIYFKQIREHGLKKRYSFVQRSNWKIIDGYTRESGVKD